jgi:sugar phosphate isomerase/epimerase
LLCYVEAGETGLDELEGLLDLASQLRCRVIVLAVIAPEGKKLTKKESQAREALEDRSWKFLYEIEDIAFEREIKISLMLEEGDVEDTIAAVVKSYNVDLCSTFSYKSIHAGDLLAKLSTVPLLFFNKEGQ